MFFSKLNAKGIIYTLGLYYEAEEPNTEDPSVNCVSN